MTTDRSVKRVESKVYSDKQILKAWKFFIKNYGKNTALADLIVNTFTTINCMKGALIIHLADKGKVPEEASEIIEDIAFPEDTCVGMLEIFFGIKERIDPIQLKDSLFFDSKVKKLFK